MCVQFSHVTQFAFLRLYTMLGYRIDTIWFSNSKTSAYFTFGCH